jgi:hypothetical protein
MTEEELKRKVVSVHTLGKLLKLSPRCIQYYAKKKGMPKYGRGEYLLLECSRWYDKRLESFGYTRRTTDKVIESYKDTP